MALLLLRRLHKKVRCMKDLIIFTDLDGSLLDEVTYRASPADSLFETLSSHGIPVVFNSSKTFFEMLKVRHSMGNRQPFVVENGSAVYVPIDHEIAGTKGLEPVHGYLRHVLGVSHQRIKDFLSSSGEAFKYSMVTQMSEAECASVTGLSASDVLMAQTRDFSEPLLWRDSEPSLKKLSDMAVSEGLRLVRGGRFVHVMGDTDKKLAQRWLVKRMGLVHGKDFEVMALGDSENDVQMLAEADYPVLIRSEKHGFPDIDTDAPVYRTKRTGPSGWHEAVKLIVLRELI